MPTNYGILQSLQQPQVVAQQPQGGGMSQGVNNLLQGIQGGQAIAQNQGILQKQQQDQAAVQQDLEMRNVIVNDPRYAKNPTGVMAEYYTKHGHPEKGVELMQGATTLNNSVLQGQKITQDMDIATAKEARDNYMHIAANVGPILIATDPVQKQKAYDEMRSTLIKGNPLLKDPKYDKVENAIYQLQGMAFAATQASDNIIKNVPGLKAAMTSDPQAAQQVQDEEAMKSGTSTTKNQLRIRQLKQDAIKAIKADQDPAPLLHEIKQLQSSIEKGPSQGRLTVGQEVTKQTTITELNKLAATKKESKEMYDSMSLAEKLATQSFSGSLGEQELAVKKGIEAVGKAIGLTVDMKTGATETLQALFKTYQIKLQVFMKGATSNRDMGELKIASPQITNTPVGRGIMVNHIKYKENMTIQSTEFLREWSEKHDGSLVGAEDAWSEFVNSRSDFDSKTLKFTKEPSRKDWKEYTSGSNTETKDTSSGNSFSDAIKGL